jgi:uncharacterized protein with HEPN domain
MDGRTKHRLNDMIDAIDQIQLLLEGKTYGDVVKDRVLRAAFERFLEIPSEASRHIPAALKSREPETAWARIAATGNHLRHAYHRVDAEFFDKSTLIANYPG